MDRSTELKLFADSSLSEFFSFFRKGPFRIRFWDKCSPHRFDPPCVYGMLSNAMPCSCGPFASSNDTPSHCKKKSLFFFIRSILTSVNVSDTYHNFQIFVQIFARRSKSFRGGVLEIPQLVFHTTVEFMRIFLPFQMKLHTDCRILRRWVRKTKTGFKGQI